MSRAYKQKKRAEAQEETRRKIVEETVALHEAIGPAATTITQIAENAGVGRLTVYRHFPDELSLITACSGHYWGKHPLPDLEPWKSIADPIERLKKALQESYAYHRSTAKMMNHALADVPDLPIWEPYTNYWAQAADIVVSASKVRGRKRSLLRAAIGHALSFTTWRSLVQEQGLTDKEAVKVMVRLSACS